MVEENERALGQEFLERFRRHLSEVDELSNVILKGHLEVESHLDDIVDMIFFRPEHLRKVRLSFFDKVLVAKAYCPDPDARDWVLIDNLNEVRNSIAHRRTPQLRAVKVESVRKLLSGFGTEAFRSEMRAADEKEIIVQTTMVCCGFLTYVEESVYKVRQVISRSLEVPSPPELKE
jgi:hypothetical protein